MAGLKYTKQINMTVPPTEDNHVARLKDAPALPLTNPYTGQVDTLQNIINDTQMVLSREAAFTADGFDVSGIEAGWFDALGLTAGQFDAHGKLTLGDLI